MVCTVKHPLVRVEWLDAYAQSSWVDDGKPSEDLTVCFGLLVSKSDRWVQLAQSHVPGPGRGYWGSVWCIPAGMVRRIQIIQRKPVCCEVKKKPRRTGA
jgi:hypothetical protein|tara:strand:- start:6 stop:302 length:297 start_codon:yes stop_codon:yes gene_type:complete